MPLWRPREARCLPERPAAQRRLPVVGQCPRGHMAWPWVLGAFMTRGVASSLKCVCGILALPQLGRVLYAITVSKFL